MEYKDVIPNRALRKFGAICMHDTYLQQNQEVQQKILSWAVDMLNEARDNWGEIHTTTIDAVIKTHYKINARKGAIIRDKKYTEFRKTFAKLQKEKYETAIQNGKKLTANGFVEWFLTNKADNMQIPYVKQNQKNKLRQLAQQNNREFKKPLPG